MRQALSITLGCVAALSLSNNAWAINCDEIMKMVDYNTPNTVILNMMKDGKKDFKSKDVKCLTRKKAPQAIIDQAKAYVSENKASAEPAAAPERTMESVKDFGSQGKELKDLPERGGASSGQPDEIRSARNKLKAKKPLTASYILHDLIQEDKYPENRAEINYYMGRSLEALKLYHVAQHYYLNVIKEGPANQFFTPALPRLVKIARHTGDESDLRRIVAKLPPKFYPRKAKNHLHYLLGVRYYQKGQLSKALDSFSKVTDKSVLFLKARYFEGVIHNQREKLKSAVGAFGDVYSEANRIEQSRDAREALLIEELKDLSFLSRGSVYYSVERFSEARTFFDKVDRNSRYWPETLFRDAWATFMLGELDVTLGKILTVESPYFDQEEFIPEAQVLKSLTYLYLCNYPKVESIIEKFENKYIPMRKEIKSFIAQYTTDEGKKLYDQAWTTYFEDSDTPLESTLPKALFHRVMRNTELSGVARHLKIMDEELSIIDLQKPKWRDSVGPTLKKIIEKDQLMFHKRAGRRFLKELAAQDETLKQLLNQANFIKIDLKEAQKDDFERKAANIDSSKLQSKFLVDFATSANLIYWPFNGEFWADELGYYSIIEDSSCK